MTRERCTFGLNATRVQTKKKFQVDFMRMAVNVESRRKPERVEKRLERESWEGEEIPGR